MEDEQEAGLGANSLQPREIPARRRQQARRARDRLDDDRGDGRRIVQRAKALQVFGELGAMRRQSAGESVACDVVRVPDVVDPGNSGSEGLAVVAQAADRDAAEVHAVVAALAANEAEATR